METFLKDKKLNITVFIFIIILSLFVAAKLFSEIKSDQFPSSVNVITVDGSGEVLATSDIATLDVTVTKDGATAKEAQSLLNEMVTKSLEYLKGQNIEDKDIKSEYGGLSPKYAYTCYTYSCYDNQKVIGYTATQTVTVKIRDVDSANTVRTGLANLGITNISGPTFSIDDEKAYQNEAQAKAIEEAKTKAEVLAKQLGVKLGKIVSFSDNSNGNGYYLKAMAVGAAMEDSVSSAPTLPKGENKITSSVTITYEIK